MLNTDGSRLVLQNPIIVAHDEGIVGINLIIFSRHQRVGPTGQGMVATDIVDGAIGAIGDGPDAVIDGGLPGSYSIGIRGQDIAILLIPILVAHLPDYMKGGIRGSGTNSHISIG